MSLVLIDIALPDRDALKFLDAMKKNSWIERIPVVIIAPKKTSDANIERAYELGVMDTISPPFDYEFELLCDETYWRSRATIRTVWSDEKTPQLTGMIGQNTDL